MDSLSIHMPNPYATGEQLVDAVHDAKQLQRALVGGGGTAKASAALFLAFFRPPGGVFLLDKLLCDAYYGILAAIAIFGATEVAAGFWVSGDPGHRRRKGKLMMWASVVPLVLVAGLGGFAVFK